MALDRYRDAAPQVESETPADTLPEGKYAAEVIGLSLKNVEGTTDDGRKYNFTNARVQIKVVHGSMKGQTTWIDPPLVTPDNSDGRLEPEMVAKLTYFTQKFYDATGFGKRFDPNWTKAEVANPKRPGKMKTTFKGRCLSKTAMWEIAASETDTATLAEMLKGCNGVFNLGLRTGTTKGGDDFETQKYKGVEPMTDANLAALSTGTAAPTGTQKTSIY